MSDVVVVESPAKAKTITRYLGSGYTVLASFGHVRDLPPKDGSVRPDEDFAMDWQSDARGEKQVGAIAKALKGAHTLYLATDPARRALDYLVGFPLSPVLWRKLPGSRSAGRVQSVALRLICEREAEIEAFKPREYWSVEVEFTNAAGDKFTARLTHLDGKRLDKFDLANEAQARAAADKILAAQNYTV